MAESDARVQAYAGQARTLLITPRALVIIEVRVTLGHYKEGEKRDLRGGNTHYQGWADMSAR